MNKKSGRRGAVENSNRWNVEPNSITYMHRVRTACAAPRRVDTVRICSRRDTHLLLIQLSSFWRLHPVYSKWYMERQIDGTAAFPGGIVNLLFTAGFRTSNFHFHSSSVGAIRRAKSRVGIRMDLSTRNDVRSSDLRHRPTVTSVIE